MAFEVQNQRPQPPQVHVAGGYTAEGCDQNDCEAAAQQPSLSSTTTTTTTLHLRHIELEELSWKSISIHRKEAPFKDRCGQGSNQLGRKEERTMSRRNGPKLELKLNLSPPRANHARVGSPSRSPTESPTSPPSSCVSSEVNLQEECLRYSTSPEATSMMLVGCPRCLMYVMLAEEEPRCPKCKSSVLLDVIHDSTTTTTITASRKPNKS